MLKLITVSLCFNQGICQLHQLHFKLLHIVFVNRHLTSCFLLLFFFDKNYAVSKHPFSIHKSCLNFGKIYFVFYLKEKITTQQRERYIMHHLKSLEYFIYQTFKLNKRQNRDPRTHISTKQQLLPLQSLMFWKPYLEFQACFPPVCNSCILRWHKHFGNKSPLQICAISPAEFCFCRVLFGFYVDL